MMPASPSLADRILGCILGGAIGDALGSPYEGRPGPLTFQPPDIWRLTDDTQLTLATCEAIQGPGPVSPERLAERLVAWFRGGRVTGVGASTLQALRALALGAHWAVAGRKGERGAGNGAAMRAAPLAFCLDPEVPAHRTNLRDLCRITHHNDEAYVGALALVLALRTVTFGGWAPGENLPARVAATLPPTMVRERLLAVASLDPATPPVEVARRFGSSGYVAESVPLAIFAAQGVGHRSLKDLLGRVIQAGGDTDTIASMTGQLAGTWLGRKRVDADLVERLPGKEGLLATVEAFAERFRNEG
jgi:ADP-ribosyl-[dinitrogen reductase] hydrolase